MFHEPTATGEVSKTFQVSVNGQAEVSHQAERALLNVVVSSEGVNKAKVSDEVITTAKHIESLLKELSPLDDSPEAKVAAAVSHWSKTSLSSTSHVPRDDKDVEMDRRYSSRINFDIRFKIFKALGPFSTKLTILPHVQLNSLNWGLTSDTDESYHSQLRREAAKDAMKKAEDYCSVLDCVNLRPVELKENGAPSNGYVGSMFGGFGQPMQNQMQLARRMGPSHDGENRDESELDFEARAVKMKHSVAMQFVADHAYIVADDGKR